MKVYKYGTGDTIPEGAVYLCSLKNGLMPQSHEDRDRYYVWHYFLVDEIAIIESKKEKVRK